jgi:hypothetical protein
MKLAADRPSRTVGVAVAVAVAVRETSAMG